MTEAAAPAATNFQAAHAALMRHATEPLSWNVYQSCMSDIAKATHRRLKCSLCYDTYVTSMQGKFGSGWQARCAAASGSGIATLQQRACQDLHASDVPAAKPRPSKGHVWGPLSRLRLSLQKAAVNLENLCTATHPVDVKLAASRAEARDAVLRAQLALCRAVRPRKKRGMAAASLRNLRPRHRGGQKPGTS